MPERLNVYGLLFVVGVLLTAWLWGRMTRRGDGGGHDARLTIIYFAGLFGALVGAKLAFFIAEGWHYREDWLALLSGRSVTGALLGGYGAVEIAKWKLAYRKPTGDFFAVLVPMALALGRIGCLVQGCCAGIECSPDAWYAWTDYDGVARWPAQLVELSFNVSFFGFALAAARFGWLPGNLFHIYLIAYGLFRFIHEFRREHIDVIGEWGGYQFIAMAMVVLGTIRFVQRRNPTAGIRGVQGV